MLRLIDTRSALRRRDRPPVVVALLVVLVTAVACTSSAPTQTPPPETPPGETAVEDGKPFKNTIKWSTASEVDNFGYDIYRSESEDGPFERINTEIVEGAGTTDEVSRYEFVDDTIDPHTTYYYYVESISMSGVRERFTPIAKTPPKTPPAEEDG